MVFFLAPAAAQVLESEGAMTTNDPVPNGTIPLPPPLRRVLCQDRSWTNSLRPPTSAARALAVDPLGIFLRVLPLAAHITETTISGRMFVWGAADHISGEGG